ncbi:MAG: GTP-binding protein [Acidimicrobiia bacterium]
MAVTHIDQANTLLRITTAGSVDDGKSTLIGRLLYDTEGLANDQLAALERASERAGHDGANLALVTDGLRAEREQGITIDAAYRFFETPHRHVILIDTPGHEQYTRNMLTGASGADVAIVLVDARHGVLAQTVRHTTIAAWLGLRHVILAVNKMDLIDWDLARYETIIEDFRAIVVSLPWTISWDPIPMSALQGENVVRRSEFAPWYEGPTMLDVLERIDVSEDAHGEMGARLAVQTVILPKAVDGAETRSYAGVVHGGPLRVGQEVVVLPDNRRSKISSIDVGFEHRDVVAPGTSVAVRLTDQIDITRGQVIVVADAPISPQVGTELVADVCWMAEGPLQAGAKMMLKLGTTTTPALVTEVRDRLDVHRPGQWHHTEELELNDLGRVEITLAESVVADAGSTRLPSGQFMLIDSRTNATLGAGLVREVRS